MDNILFTTDFTKFDQYDRHTMAKSGYKYSDLVRREQKFLRNLIMHRYHKTHECLNLVVMVYIHANFGKREKKDYKVVARGSDDYNRLVQTDDWNEVGGFKDLKEFLNKL